METILPMTTLQRNPNDAKAAAQDGIVRITEQGRAAYIFASEEAFNKRIARERADAAYEARLIEAVGRGVDDIDAGRYTDSIDSAFDRAETLRANHG
ncbi:MAG: hypothetical protein PUD09_02680 [Coriobacteriales bacterium]|nr:hypothetical protein [Coriobacteriales bacterium]